jgi:hypothetical protein
MVEKAAETGEGVTVDQADECPPDSHRRSGEPNGASTPSGRGAQPQRSATDTGDRDTTTDAGRRSAGGRHHALRHCCLPAVRPRPPCGPCAASPSAEPPCDHVPPVVTRCRPARPAQPLGRRLLPAHPQIGPTADDAPRSSPGLDIERQVYRPLRRLNTHRSATRRAPEDLRPDKPDSRTALRRAAPEGWTGPGPDRSW